MEKQSRTGCIPIKDYWLKAKEIKQKYNLKFDITPYLLSEEQCNKINNQHDYYNKGAYVFHSPFLNVKRAKKEGFTTEQTLFLNLLKAPTGMEFDFIKEQVKKRNDNFFKIPTMDKQTFFHSAIAYDYSPYILPILNAIKEKCNQEDKKLADYIDFERQDENYGVRKNILQLALVKTYIYDPSKYENEDPEFIDTNAYYEKIETPDGRERLKKFCTARINKDQQVIDFLIENSTKGALINKDGEGYNILDYAIYRMDRQNLEKIIDRAKKDNFLDELIANSKIFEKTKNFEDLITKINEINVERSASFKKNRYHEPVDLFKLNTEGIKLFYKNKEKTISFLKNEKQLFEAYFPNNKKIKKLIELYELKQSLNTKNKEITKLKKQFYKKLPQMLYKNDKIDKRMKKRKQISQKEKELKNLKSKIEKIDKQNFVL